MLGSVADEQDTHVAPITRTQAGRHRRTGGAGQHVQFDGRVSAKPPPLLAHCDSEDRPRSGAADRVVSGGWALIAAAISAGCATAERTALIWAVVCQVGSGERAGWRVWRGVCGSGRG